jgi:tetratricopeptide (TPR) repeat protein
MALLAMGLMMPRAAPPEDVPLPKLDARVLDAARAIDTSRAVSARRDRLPSQVLLVGTTLRALNTASARNASDDDVGVRRTAVDQAVRALLSDGETAFEQLATLRALQLEAFLAEVEAFEATGQASAELDALGGGFVDRMRAAGWLDGQRVLLDENERRVAFKLVWSAQLGVERVKPLALSIDEQRVLYALYIRRPHVPEAQRASYVSLRSAANTDEACKRAVAEEAVATDQWRIEKVKRLGELDAEYPTAFALGVLYYRVGRFDAATEAFRSWLEKHPDGPYTLRARNHIKAAHLAGGPS